MSSPIRLALSLLLAIPFTPVSAGEVPAGGYGVYDHVYSEDFEFGDDWHLFEANEFFIDGFYTVRDFSGAEAVDGAGLGVGYFFSRHCGVMVEGFGLDDETSEDFVLSGSALMRIPVDHAAFALYALVGTGYSFGDTDQWNFEIGGGVDVRLLDRLGGFFDARYVEPDKGRGGTAFRVGVRHLF